MKLVKPKAKPIKRPFATHYYRALQDRDAVWTSQGAASTEQGAVRATVVRVFLEQYAKAIISDRRTGVVIYSVTRGAAGIRVHYGMAGLRAVA